MSKSKSKRLPAILLGLAGIAVVIVVSMQVDLDFDMHAKISLHGKLAANATHDASKR
jgi:hypothetical protein